MGKIMMFGIGIGEIIVILLVIFLVSPRDLPKVMKKAGQFFGELARIKQELYNIKDDVNKIVRETEKNKGKQDNTNKKRDPG